MAARAPGPQDVAELLATLSGKLCAITDCDILIHSLYDPARESICNYVWQQGKISTRLVESIDPAVPVTQAWGIDQPVLVQDVASEEGFPEVVQAAREAGMGSFCWLPLSASGRRIGAVVFGSGRAQAFREDDLVFLGNVAKLVGLTMENAQALTALQRERDSLARISGGGVLEPAVGRITACHC